MLKAKNKYFLKMSKYRNTVYYDFKSHFLVIFFFNYWHCLVLKIPFPDHIFPKISKFCTENLHSLPLANTTLPPPPLAPPPPPLHDCFYIQIPSPFPAKVVLLDEKQYVINSMAEKAAYSVLRLFPYRCILNPIEMARASLEYLYK